MSDKTRSTGTSRSANHATARRRTPMAVTAFNAEVRADNGRCDFRLLGRIIRQTSFHAALFPCFPGTRSIFLAFRSA